MAKKRRELPELTPAQGEIMDIVWDVRRGLRQRGATGPLANPQGRPQHRPHAARAHGGERLDQRIVRRDGPFLYSAAQPRQATIGQKVQEVVETVCGGSAEALVTALLDYRGLNSGEL